MKKLLLILSLVISFNLYSQTSTYFESHYDSTNVQLTVLGNIENNHLYNKLSVTVMDADGKETVKTFSYELQTYKSGGSEINNNGKTVPFQGTHFTILIKDTWVQKAPKGKYLIKYKLTLKSGAQEEFPGHLITL
tara:strand:- start:22 stop:426 length:405 start_codon:yes stop_codon:yes gene_type:complete